MSNRLSGGYSPAVDSPSSDTSQTVRTGYPEAPLSPYVGTGALRPEHYRNLSSDESYTASGHVPYLARTSDEYDTPSLVTTTTDGSYPLIHDSRRANVPSPVRTTLGQAGTYRTNIVTPTGTTHHGVDRTEHGHHSASSYASSGAPEIVEKRSKQEELDREIAASLIQEENRRVHFESDRAKYRAEQRAEQNFAAHEQRRAEDRERIRQQAQKEREAKLAKEAREAAAAAAARRPKPSPKSSANTTKPSVPTRRGSVRKTTAEAATQQHLLAAEARQMEAERQRIEAIEREEQMQQQKLTHKEQQQDPRYYDPRGGNLAMPTGPGSMSRRDSLSNSARPDLGRSHSHRNSQAYPAARQDRGPPVSYYNNGSARGELPSARVRRPSSSHGERPGNPFAHPTPQMQPVDPWDNRNLREALPTYPQQATDRLNRAFYDNAFEDDSDEHEYHRRRR